MSDPEKRAIELGILSIGGFDVDQCACDVSVGVFPCHYCAEWGAIFAGRRVLEQLAEQKAENFRLTQGILAVATMCDNCNTLYNGQTQLHELLKGGEAKGGCDPCWVDSLQDELDKAKKTIETLRNALRPFATVGENVSANLTDYWCHHHDHFVGHYRAAVAAMTETDQA